jgi:cytochrome c oxidase subunit 4
VSPDGLRGYFSLPAGVYRTDGWGLLREMGVFNPIAAIAIACIKMVLVVLFFMHVKYSSKLTMLTVCCGFFMFLVLVGMTMADYISRAWGRW